jgi:hypothetical protein
MKNLKAQIMDETNCRFVYAVQHIPSRFIAAVYTSKFKAKRCIQEIGNQTVITRIKLQ